MRATRYKLKFDEDSLNKLLQEVYNDVHIVRAKTVRLFSKWEQKVKEGGEIAAIGDQIIKLLGVEAKNQDQKIMLLKYLKEIVFDIKNFGKKPDKDEPVEDGAITSENRNDLIEMVKKEIDRKNLEKKNKK
jgi:hypothetical protein